MKPKHRFSRSRRNALALSASMVVCLSSGALAQTANNWTGTVSSDWNNVGNWSAGVLPTKAANYHAVINTATPNIATITVGILAPVDLIIGTGAGASGRLDHPAGDGLTGSGNWMYVGTNGGTGVYNLANTTSPGSGISGYSQGSGSMNTNGGRFYVGGFGAAGSNGVANINTTGTLTVGSEMNISATGGTGVMNLESGTIVVNDWTRIGGGAGSKGTLNMTGGTLTKQGVNHLVIGGTGSTGIANVSGGTINVATEFWIANAAGSTGTFNFSGGSIVGGTWASIGRDTATKGTVNFTGGTWTKSGAGNFIVGDNSPGELNLSGASSVLTVTGEFWIGQNGGSTGTMNFAGGSVTNSSWVAIGRGGNAVLNMTGGTWTKNGTGSNFIIGSQGSGKNGTMNMSGGTVTVQPSTTADRGITWVGEQNGNTGNFNLSGTAEFTTARVTLGVNSGATGNMTANGGTLRVGQITGGSGTANVTFNGAQVVASASSGAFVDNLDSASINAGALKIDTNNFNLTTAQVFTGSGGVVKSGGGTLTLNGASTYAGAHSINGGKLVLSTASNATGAITVADYCTLGVTQSAINDPYSTSALTFGAFDATTLDIDLGTFAGNTTAAPLNVTGSGSLTLNGLVTLNVADNFPAVGTIPLVSYSGGKGGTGSFQLGTLPDGVLATLSDNGTDLVSLSVTRVNDPYWTGAVDTQWNATTANWTDDYAETAATFADGDPAMFDDRVIAAGPAVSVTLDAVVAPGGSGVTFANATKNYTLSGTGKITGTTGLLKQGAGTLILDTANDYTGVTRVNGGTLRIAAVADGGLASPIGAADSNEANLILGAGTLHHTGPASSTNRGFTTTGAGVISTDNDLTISGAAASTATGSFSKSGAGNLRFTLDGVNVFGGGGAAGITVQNGPLTFDGTGTSQVNSVVNDIWVGTTATAGGSLFLENTSLTTTNWLAIGRGNGDNGVVNLTANGSTLTTVNFSTGYDNGLANNASEAFVTLHNTTWTNNGLTYLAESAGSTATMSLTGTSQYNINNNLLLARNAATCLATLTLSDSSSLTKTGGYTSIGTNGTGTLTVQNNATFTSLTGDFNISDVGTSTGFLFLKDSGTINVTNVYIGKNSSTTGTFTQTGGSFSSGSFISIGRVFASNGTVDISAGSLSSTTVIVVGEEGTGTLNVSGSATVTANGDAIYVGGGASTFGGVGTLNLNGGTVVAKKITGGTIGTSTVNFNGGLLKAGTGATSPFIGGFDSAVIQSGGARVDSNGQNLTVSQLLTGSGGFTKSGTGTVTLSAANTYTGPTAVNAGTLSVSSAFFANTSAISIASGAVLNLNHAATDQVGSLSINGSSMPPGTYDSTTSPGVITGAGKLQVTGTASAYDTWISGFPSIPLADRDPGDDPDGDGSSNALEFALGGVPNNGSNNPKVYGLVADSSADGDSNKEMLLTIAVRGGTPAFSGSPSPSAVQDGYTYRVEGGATLGSFNTVVNPVNPVTSGLPAVPSGYEYRTFSLSGSNGTPGSGFLRVRVVSP